MMRVTHPERVRHPEKIGKPDNPIRRKPPWIRVRAPTSPVYHETRATMRELGLVTVCEEAACPNIGECWSKRHATMMILGSVCTRACAFCNVATGLPDLVDRHEPMRVAEAVARLGLRHVVMDFVGPYEERDVQIERFAKEVRPLLSVAS